MSKHITEKQRYAISKMLQVPMSKKDIAEAIGVDRSNIYREIKRNCDSRSGKYNPDLAQRKADKRKFEKKRKEVFTQAMKKRVKKLLRKDLSPEQIVGRSQVENIAMVSHETIYCWIWQDKRQGGVFINLLEGKDANIQSVVLKTQVEDLFRIEWRLISDLQL